MARFIQYATHASLYDGEFGGTAGWPAAGMGDIIVTKDGRLIVVDGGHSADAEGLLALLEKETDGTAGPTVALWVITHPHGDHTGALRAISLDARLRERVEIQRIVWYFPQEFRDARGVPGALASADAEMREICAACGAEPHTPARGEEIAVDDVRLTFLYVPDDCSIYGSTGKNVNLCSLILSVAGETRRVLVTGDAFRPSLQITAFRYGQALKCDALQMPHHALCDSWCEDFYRLAAPTTVLLPISRAGYRAMHSTYAAEEGARVNAAVESAAREVFKAFEGNAELKI